MNNLLQDYNSIPFLTMLRMKGAIKRNPLNTLLKLHKKSGSNIRINAYSRPVISISDPRSIEYLSKQIGKKYQISEQLTSALIPLYSDNGTHSWHTVHQLNTQLHEKLNSDQISANQPIIREEVENLLEEWLGVRLGRDKVNIELEMRKLLVRIVCRIFFSPLIDINSDGFIDSLSDISEFAVFYDNPKVKLKSLYRPVHTSLSLKRNSATREAVTFINDSAEKIAIEFMNERSEKGILLEQLTPIYHNHETSFQIAVDALKTFLYYYTEPIASATAWLLFCLDHFKGMKRQIDDEINTTGIDNYARNTNFLLTKAIYETQLLYPSYNSMFFSVTEEDRLGDSYLPIGSLMVISPFVLHRMNFPDKDFDRFDPSRWTQQYLSELPRFSYLPFAAFFHPPQYTDNAVNLTALITKELMKELRIYFYAKKEPAFSNTDILRPKENFLARIEKRKAR